MSRDHEPPEAASGSSALGSSLSSDVGDREPSALSGGFGWASDDDDEDRSDITELYDRVRHYTADPAEYGRRLAAAHERLAEPYDEDGADGAADDGAEGGGADPDQSD